MTEEQIKQKAEEKGVEYADKQERIISVHEDSSYSWLQVEEGYENGYIDGYQECQKEREWHYCKDELPNHNGQFYVALKGHKETYILNYDYDEDNDDKMVWVDEDDTNFDEEVYAWCEKLEAPKEIE